MKRIISLLIVFQMFCLPCFAAKDYVIEDTFAQTTLKDVKTQPVNYNREISDELIDAAFVKKTKPAQLKDTQINDEFASKALTGSAKKQAANLDYDYSNGRKPVKIKSLHYITTRSRKLDEGQYVTFQTVENVTLQNGAALPKETKILGRIETITPNGVWGAPADIKIANFVLKDNTNVRFTGSIDKIGANRSLWVYPAVYGMLPFLGAGLLLIPVRGGHAKITTRKTYTIYSMK